MHTFVFKKDFEECRYIENLIRWAECSSIKEKYRCKTFASAAKKAAQRRRVENKRMEREATARRKLQEQQEGQKQRQERALVKKENMRKNKQENLEKERHDKQVSKYLARFELECQKLDILHNHETAMECAGSAIKGVSVAQINSFFIKGKEDEIHKAAIKSQLTS